MRARSSGSRWRRRCWLPLALSLSAFALAGGAVAAGGEASFSLQPFPPRSPAYFIFTAKRGASRGGTLQLANVGSATGSAILYPVDATTASSGGAAYLARTSPRRDVGRWLHLAFSRVTLKPRQQALIPFTLSVPAEGRAGQHLGGIVAEDVQAASTRKQGRRGGFQIRIRHLTIVAVEVTLPGASKLGVQATGLRTAIQGKRQTILIGLRNTGTLIVKPTGSLLVFAAHHRLRQRTQLRIGTFLPQTSIEYPIYARGRPLPNGTYTASLLLRYGANGLTRWHTTFTITSK